MKRLLATLSLVAISATAASAATPAPHHTAAPKNAKAAAKKPAPVAYHTTKIAPADEYFGRLKISILGMVNMIKDGGIKYDQHPDQIGAVFGSVSNVEDAIHDWQKKYPQDPWLPKTLLALERLYIHCSSDDAKKLAARTAGWMQHDFPKSNYAALGRRELAEAMNPPPPVATPADTAATTGAAAAAAAVSAPAAVATPVPLNPAAPPAANPPK